MEMSDKNCCYITDLQNDFVLHVERHNKQLKESIMRITVLLINLWGLVYPNEVIERSECEDICRSQYMACRLLCETDYCLSICTREYEGKSKILSINLK